ncbi:hypothetical protein T492DRAFT_866532, partial [Pavlovales sp. CCMP2436]
AAELAELEAAAVLIQSYSRGLRSRAQVSEALIFGEEAALRKRERGAAASIQARVRGRAVRTGAGDEGNLADDEAVPADTSALELAATHVQAHARGMAARAAGTHEPAQAAEPDAGFAELDTAATLIQARARGRTARSTIGATEQAHVCGVRARAEASPAAEETVEGAAMLEAASAGEGCAAGGKPLGTTYRPMIGVSSASSNLFLSMRHRTSSP